MSLLDADNEAQYVPKVIIPKIKIEGVHSNFEPWLNMARNRTFSLAAGTRAAYLGSKVMEVGFAKVLYAADQLGADIEQSSPFVFFAPDGTISYNPIRTRRGFAYGAVLDFDFDGLMATNNSMPNGCGFSIYELPDPMEDNEQVSYLRAAQKRMGKDELTQLGKGNHFAGIYYVNDPITGEDTGRRFLVVHCSGHVGGQKLYFPNEWLADEDGYHTVQTPHGEIILLEGEAQKRYREAYQFTDAANAENRDLVMKELFGNEIEWKKLEEITHQGLKGTTHIIGTQVHDGLMPIAFNPEEGLVVAKTIPNLSSTYIDCWSHRERAEQMGVLEKFKNLNITPHGGGYEFKNPISRVTINLDHEGIQNFNLKFDNDQREISYAYHREIREHMTYRRKAPVLDKIFKANLAEIVYELPPLLQIYPLESIPGGTH